MKLTKLRLFTAGVLLSAPLGVVVCNKMKDNSAIVNPANEAIEAERKALQEKEAKFVKNLDNWLMWLDIVSSHLRDHEKIDSYTELNFAQQEFLGTIIGDHGNDAIVPDEFKTPTEKIVDKVNRIVESMKPPRKMKNDFRTDPSKDQIEAFIKVITMADKLAPTVTLDDVHKHIEKRAQRLKRPADATEKSKEIASEGFAIYKEILAKLIQEKPKLIQAMDKFNENAKEPYKSKWGLSSEFLKSLESIKE